MNRELSAETGREESKNFKFTKSVPKCLLAPSNRS